MKILYPAILLIFLLPLFVNAQSNYKPGYVIGLKGDTAKGFIDYREWGSNPDAINFKTSLSVKESKKFTAGDITFFEVSGLESYQRYAGPISTDAIDPEHAGTTRDTSTKQIVTFLKVLQQGKRVTLYAYNDGLKPRFFIKDVSDQLPSELIYRVYTGSWNTNPSPNMAYRDRTIYENVYFKQLFVLAAKYGVLTDTLSSEIQHADYYKQNLIKIVSKINGISDTEYKKKYDEHSKISFFASLAANFANIQPYGIYKSAGAKAATSTLPAISFGIDLWANPNTGKLRFALEGTVSGNSYNSIYIYTGSPYVPVRYSYNDTWFALSPQVVYNFYNAQNFKVFAGLGLAFTFHDYKGDYDINYAGTVVNGAPLKSDNFLNNQGGGSFFDTFNYPVVLKAGVSFAGRLEIFGRYYTPCKISQDHYFLLNNTNTQIGLSYLFK